MIVPKEVASDPDTLLQAAYKKLNAQMAERNHDLFKTVQYLEAATKERDKAIAVLKENQQFYRLLSETLPQFIWISQIDGTVETINQAWLDYTQTSHDDNVNVTFEKHVHPEDLEACRRQWQQAKAQGEPFQIKYRLKRAKDGLYRWHQTHLQPIRDWRGETSKWLGIATDIHDKK